MEILSQEWEKRQKQYIQIKEFDAAAEYWARKRNWHTLAACLIAMLTLIAAGFGIRCVLELNLESRNDLKSVISDANAKSAAQPGGPAAIPAAGAGEHSESAADSSLSAWRIALLLRESFPTLVSVVAIFWLLRILVRIFLTQLHQWSDASERVVMVNTYLAMHVGAGILEGKSAVDEKARTIVLTQIFRHGISGLYKDDAAPMTPLDALKATSSAGEHGHTTG